MSFNVYGLGGLINKSIKIKIINDKQPQMEQHTLKNVSNCLNANIYSYLETLQYNKRRVDTMRSDF